MQRKIFRLYTPRSKSLNQHISFPGRPGGLRAAIIEQPAGKQIFQIKPT